MNELIEFDRNLLLQWNGSSNPWWDGVMWTLSDTLTWIPLLLVTLYVMTKSGSFRQFILFCVMLALVIAAADQLSASVLKPYFHRLRPTHDPAIMEMVKTVNGYTGGKYGFVSSHAANAFAVFAFMSLAVRNGWFSLGLLSWAILTSFSRIYLGVHYPGDVFCGAMVGLIIGLVFYIIYHFLHNRMSSTRQFYSSAYTSTGILVADVHEILFVLSLTYAYICIRAIFFCAL